MSRMFRERPSNRKELSRRDFLKNSSFVGIGAIASSVAADHSATGEQVDTSKILNYNSKMRYRRLGKTGLVLSEIGIGGHWRAPWRERSHGWWWGKFIDDEDPAVPEEVSQNRTDVVSVCIEAGVNHLDITGLAEAMGFGAALKGRRDKMIVAADDYKACMRHREHCNVKSQIENVESCLKALGSDYIDVNMGPADVQRVAFLNAGPRHHALAIVPLEMPQRLHHLMLQVTDMDDVGTTYDLCHDQGVPIAMSLGRHTNDRMTSFYMQTPSGFQVEYGAGGVEIDDETWEIGHYDAPSIWGHRPSA